MSSSCQGFFTPRVPFLYVCRREGFTHEDWRKELCFCIYAVVLYSILCIFFLRFDWYEKEDEVNISVYTKTKVFLRPFFRFYVYYLRPYVACSFLVKSINEVVSSLILFLKKEIVIPFHWCKSGNVFLPTCRKDLLWVLYWNEKNSN